MKILRRLAIAAIVLAAAILAMAIFGHTVNPDLRAFDARRAAWHAKCDDVRTRNITIVSECAREGQAIVAEGKAKGWIQ